MSFLSNLFGKNKDQVPSNPAPAETTEVVADTTAPAPPTQTDTPQVVQPQNANSAYSAASEPSVQSAEVTENAPTEVVTSPSETPVTSAQPVQVAPNDQPSQDNTNPPTSPS